MVDFGIIKFETSKKILRSRKIKMTDQMTDQCQLTVVDNTLKVYGVLCCLSNINVLQRFGCL